MQARNDGRGRGSAGGDDVRVSYVQPPCVQSPTQGAPRMGARVRTVLVVLAAFQLLHWFKPSEPYLVDWATAPAGPYNVTTAVVLHRVFPVATYSMVPATVLVALVHAGAGHTSGLLACGVAGAVTVAFVLFGRVLDVLIASEFLWAASFAALFVVSAAMYRLVPRRLYQTASSLSTAAMLTGTVTSSVLGYGMTSSGASASAVRATFIVSFASAVAALVVLVVAVACGWLKAAADTSDDTHSVNSGSAGAATKRSGALSWYVACGRAAAAAYTTPMVLAWTAISVFMRGPHTLVITNWAELSKDVAPSSAAQSYNGLVVAASYLVATVCVSFPGSRLLSDVVRRVGHWVVLVLAALAVVCCGALGLVQSMFQLGVVLTVYNSVAETLLAIASARIAASLPLRDGDAAFAMQFPVAVGGKYLGGIVWQLIMQAVADVLRPGVRAVFWLYAAFMVLAVVAALVVAVAIGARRLASSGEDDSASSAPGRRKLVKAAGAGGGGHDAAVPLLSDEC